MAIARLNPIFESVHGRIGDLVIKQYGTKLVFSRRPVFRNRKFSPAQKACQENFRQATLFARQLMADPRARKAYEEEARVKGKSVRGLMIADYLHAQVPREAGPCSGARCLGSDGRDARATRIEEQVVQAKSDLTNRVNMVKKPKEPGREEGLSRTLHLYETVRELVDIGNSLET